MGRASFYSRRGVTSNNTKVDPVQPNRINAIEDSVNSAAISEANAEAAKAEAEQKAAEAEAARQAAIAAKAVAEAAKLEAEAAEATAATLATTASQSATTAATQASDAASSAADAFTQAQASAASAASAATEATNAATSAASSEANRVASVAAQTAAETAQAAAETAEANSATSAANAAVSESNAASSASASASSAAASLASETASAASQVASATSAANSAASAVAASTSESNAATSAADAAASATLASTAKTASEAARDSALAALDSFDDRYLGVKSADPSVDNDGNALVSGSLYFNDQTNSMLVFDGTSWLAAYASLSGALLQTSNLSDLTDVALARSNLGLGTVATTDATAYATAAQGTNADTAFGWGDHSAVGYAAGIHTHTLSDITDAGTAAASATTDFATAAQGATADAALARSGGTMTGDITFAATQLFDGRDVSADGAKLDGIEAGATADQTKADIDALGIAASTAATLATARSISLAGDVSGSASFDGSANISITATVADDSHNHVISNVDGLQTALDGKLSTTGKAADSDLLDGINSSSFLRSDADDTFSGLLVSNARNNGISGTYDSTLTDQIWTMGASFRNASDGSNFGNLYGLAYKHTNNATGGTMASGHQMVWCQNGTGYAALGSNIWTSGNVTAYSDIRVKTNLEIIPDAVAKVKALNGYTFDRTDVTYDEYGQPLVPIRQTGVVAQEVLEVLPEAVTGDEDSHYSVAYGNMVGLLIEAIKEQQAQIDELKAKLEG